MNDILENNRHINIPEFNNISYDEILNKIKNFKTNFFPRNIPFREIKSEIEKIGLGYRKENYYWFRFKDGLYRARKHDKKWLNTLFPKTGELWYRDWSKTDKSEYKYERLNHPGENFMYLSMSRNASILEVRPNEGDWVTVANIVPFTKTKLNLCMVAEEYMRQASPDLDIIICKPNKGNRRLDDDSFRKVKLIDDFLVEIFTAKVEDENDYKYKTSIAVWEYLKSLNSSKTISGIMYPSVALNYDAINIGVRPSAIDSNYGVDQLITFAIDSVIKLKNKTILDFHPVKIGKSTLLTSRSANINWRDPDYKEIKAYSTRIEYENKM